MDKQIIEDLINKKLSTTQIAKELNISQTNVRYWIRKYSMNTFFTSHNKFCKKCNSALKGKQLMYCSKRCKLEEYTDNPNNYACQQERAKHRKEYLINLKGGKCEGCGYNKNLGALSFHHKDPTDKLFSLDSRKISNTNMRSILIEAEKCQLLCLNCHMETHHPNLDIENGIIHEIKLEDIT